MQLGPHGFFIVAAYAGAALIILALILHAVFDHRGQLAALAELESRGAGRRSEAAPPSRRETPDEPAAVGRSE